MMKQIIYILDDDQVFSCALEMWLHLQGDYEVEVFDNSEKFFIALSRSVPDIIILDYSLNEETSEIKNGGDVAAKISGLNFKIPVIMLSGQKEIQVAVDLFTNGIIDYISKDDNFHKDLKRTLSHLDAKHDLQSEINLLKYRSKKQFKRLTMFLLGALLFWTMIEIIL